MDRPRSLGSLEPDPRSVITVGSFDGVHRGHQEIIRYLVERARETGGRSVVVTFDPHPQEVLRRGGTSVSILSTLDERAREFEKLGVDLLVVIPFTAETAATSWRDFLDNLKRNIGVAEIVMGHDHAFGRNREGTPEVLRAAGEEEGFAITQIPPLEIDGVTVSSSKIRNALLEGDVALAEHYLGRPYTLTGTVVRGDGRGRSIGLPTANITPDNPSKLIPANGVYCVTAEVAGRDVRGMTNIGVRPSFTDGTVRTIETNLLDFDEEIYHTSITLRFRRFVRSEQKFDGPQAFLAQLALDRAVCESEG